MLLSWFRKLLKSFEVSNMITQCFNNPTRSLFWLFFFLKIIQYFLNFFLSLCTVNIIQLLKWIIYLGYFIHFMNMFFILHIIFGCQKNIGKFFLKFVSIPFVVYIYGDNISNQSAQSFFCMVSFFFFFFTTQHYLHMLIYLPARVYNQVYKGKYHFDGVSFETPHWHLSNTGTRVQTMSHFRRVSNIQHESNIQRRGAHGVIEINFCSFLFWP